MPNVIVTVGQHRAQLLDGTTSPYEALARMGVAPRNLKRRGRGWLAGQADSGRCNCLWLNVIPPIIRFITLQK